MDICDFAYDSPSDHFMGLHSPVTDLPEFQLDTTVKPYVIYKYQDEYVVLDDHKMCSLDRSQMESRYISLMYHIEQGGVWHDTNPAGKFLGKSFVFCYVFISVLLFFFFFLPCTTAFPLKVVLPPNMVIVLSLKHDSNPEYCAFEW